MEEGRSMEQEEDVLDARAPSTRPPPSRPPRAHEEVPKQEVVFVEEQKTRKEQIVVAVMTGLDMVEYEQQLQAIPQ